MTGRGRIRGALRWPAIVVLGLLGGLVLVEIVLQLAALAVRHSDRRELPSPDVLGERVVLCVGDSFTYGMGAKPSEAYPVRLEERLRAAQPEVGWSVVTDAWPGRSSGEVVELLPGILRRFHPDYVCVLVGSTDAWRIRAAPAPDEGPAGLVKSFLGSLRLARLFMGRRPVGEDGAAAPSTPIAAPERPLPATAADWTLEDLEQPPADGVVDATRRMAFERIRAQLASSGDSAGTVRLLRAAERDKLVRLLLEEGERLNRERGPSAEVCRLMAIRAGRVLDPERGLSLARQAVALDPANADGLRVLAEAEWLWGTAEAAVQALAGAYAAGLEEERVERWFRRFGLPSRFTPEEFTGLLGDQARDPDRRDDLVRIFRRAGERMADARVGVQHLERIAAIAREQGASPVFLTYPSVGRGEPVVANEAIRDVAARQEVTLVDLAPVFAEAVTRTPVEELFGLDGHCTARGYGIVAEQVADALLRD